MIQSLLMLALLGADPPAVTDEAVAAEVHRLARQLDANQLAEREAAERRLIELGPPILDHLPPITRRTSAEVRQRLTRVRQAVETAAGRAATEPTRVTLSGRMPLREAVEAIERQTGNRITGHENRDLLVDVDFQDLPFWQALDGLLDQAQLTVSRHSRSRNVLTLTARPAEHRSRQQQVEYAGVFRIEPTRVEATRNLRNPQVEGLRVAVEISWEPRLRPINLAQPLDAVQVTDERGNRLETARAARHLTTPVEGTLTAIELELPLVLPPRSVSQLSELQGTLDALVPGRVESFEFRGTPGVESDSQRKAGVTVTLERIRENAGLYEYHLRVQFDEASQALESHRGWIYENDAHLRDPQGRRIEYAGLQATGRQLNEAGVAYLFALDEPLTDEYAFVYTTPALIIQMAVPYTLKDVSLP